MRNPVAKFTLEDLQAEVRARKRARKAVIVRLNFTPNAISRGRKLGLKVRQERAQAVANAVLPRILEARKLGRSLAEIAEMLNAEGFRTSRGKLWRQVSVKRILDRAPDGTGTG
jgi:hypothetical protein